MNYFKLQLGCFAIILYIAIVYMRDCKRYGMLKSIKPFHLLLGMGLISVFSMERPLIQ